MPRASTALDRLVRPGPNLWERSPDRDSNLPTIQCPGIAAIGRQVALGKRSHQAPTVGAVSRPRLKPPNDPMSRHCGNRLASRAWKALPPSLRLWERSPDRDSSLPPIQCPGIAAIGWQVALGKRSHQASACGSGLPTATQTSQRSNVRALRQSTSKSRLESVPTGGRAITGNGRGATGPARCRPCTPTR